MKKLLYAMVGGAEGSFIGPIHRMAIRMDDLAILVAGSFSRDEKVNKLTGEKCEVAASRIYSDWKRLIASEKGKIDFISICTPNDSHYEIAKAALNAGIDVFCEKPLSLTLEEAKDLEKIAKKKKRILAIPFTYSGFPMVKAARDLVAKGELGEIYKVVVEYQQGSFSEIDFTKPLSKRSKWKMDPKKAGPSCVVADIGVHGFYLIEYITGIEIKSLLADLSSFAPGNKLDDDASILLRLKSGAKGAMVVSKIASGEENGVRVRIYGSKASIYWNQEAPNYLSVKYPSKPEAIYKRKAPFMVEASLSATKHSRIPAGHHEGFIEAFANIYDEFCEAVIDRKSHDFPGAYAGVRTMRLVEATLESHRDGNKWIKV